MNNKQKKNKNIHKQQALQKKKSKSKKSKHIFTKDLVDLLSSSEKEQIQPQIQVASQEDQMADIQDIALQIKNKYVQISNQKYAYAVQTDKYYRVKIDHLQANKIFIELISKKNKFFVNGKSHTCYRPNQNFVIYVQQIQQESMQQESAKAFYNIQSREWTQFLKIVDFKRQAIFTSNKCIKFQQCNNPWANLPSCIDQNDSLMIIGLKNTGKSTLSEYILNTKGNDCALLDCDIGRNFCMQGCISLISENSSKKIWIGQLTPLNNLQTYIRGIRYLFKYYRQNWFTKKLIVNTMGYTTGLGELILYEIYQIVTPKSIIAVQLPQSNKYDSLSSIIKNIQNGEYINRLHISRPSQEQLFATTTKFYYYQNKYAVAKKYVSRFQRMFQCGNRNISHICDLLKLINQSRSSIHRDNTLQFKMRKQLSIYEQSRHKKQQLEGVEIVRYRLLALEEDVNMRLIVLGKMINEETNSNIPSNPNQCFLAGLFQVSCLAFGFDNFVYSTGSMEGLIGIVSEGTDFQKGFYHLNQKQLIDIQLRMGRLPYMIVASKGLGSKGMRNNPSKTQ